MTRPRLRSLQHRLRQAGFVDAPKCVPAPINQHHRNVFGVYARQLHVIKNVHLVECAIDGLLFDTKLTHNTMNRRASVITQVTSWFREQGYFNRFRHEIRKTSLYAGKALEMGALLLVATLMTSLAKQLAVLLLRHTLATLLNN